MKRKREGCIEASSRKKRIGGSRASHGRCSRRDGGVAWDAEIRGLANENAASPKNRVAVTCVGPAGNVK